MLGAGQLQVLAEQLQQCLVGLECDFRVLAVHDQPDHHAFEAIAWCSGHRFLAIRDGL